MSSFFNFFNSPGQTVARVSASPPNANGVWTPCQPRFDSPLPDPPATGGDAGLVTQTSFPMQVYVPTSANRPPQGNQDLLCFQDRDGNWIALPIRVNSITVRYFALDYCGRTGIHAPSFAGISWVWTKGSTTHTFTGVSGTIHLTNASDLGTWSVTVSCPSFTSQTFSVTLGWGSNPDVDVLLRTTDATTIHGAVQCCCGFLADHSGVTVTVFSGGVSIGTATTITDGEWTFTIPEPPLIPDSADNGGSFPVYTATFARTLWVMAPAGSPGPGPTQVSVICGQQNEWGNNHMVSDATHHCTSLCRDPAAETLTAVDPVGNSITLTWDATTQQWWGCRDYATPPTSPNNPNNYVARVEFGFDGSHLNAYTDWHYGGTPSPYVNTPFACGPLADTSPWTGGFGTYTYYGVALAATSCTPLDSTGDLVFNGTNYPAGYDVKWMWGNGTDTGTSATYTFRVYQ